MQHSSPPTRDPNFTAETFETLETNPIDATNPEQRVYRGMNTEQDFSDFKDKEYERGDTSWDTVSTPVATVSTSPFLSSWTSYLPIFIAIFGTALLIGGLKYLGGPSYLRELLLERSWTQYATVAIFFWGFGHILRRFLKQTGEKDAVKSCQRLLKSNSLEAKRVPMLMGALFPIKKSLAGQSLTSILSYFRASRPSRDEVMAVATQELEWAQDCIDADYRALNAALWLLPLAGFIGTVVGMSGAIAGFQDVIGTGAGSISDLGPALGGLTTAFDTTFLALVLVIPLKLLEVGLQARDRNLIDTIDQVVGTGLVRTLDLGVVAQQSPEEAALQRFAEGVSQVGENLEVIDRVLARISKEVQQFPSFGETFMLLREQIAHIADATRETSQSAAQAVKQQNVLASIDRNVEGLRRQSEQPLTLIRGNTNRPGLMPRSTQFDEEPR